MRAQCAPPFFWCIAARFAEMVVRQLGLDVLVNCGPGETAMAREVVARSNSSRVFSLADQPLNIHAGKICLKRAGLTVSTDSGPHHIASAFGNPTIVLLGPTRRNYIENPMVDRIAISRHLSCFPCYTKSSCPEGHARCMTEITPEIVFEKVLEIRRRSLPPLKSD